MLSQLAVLDFDGAMTLVEAEGAPFTQAVIKTLAPITSRTEDEIGPMYIAGMRRLDQEPGRGIAFDDGVEVAPANVDPYLRSRLIAHWIMEECGLSAETVRVVAKLFSGPLYAYHYGFSGNAPRPGLTDFLKALHARMEGRVAIVTNSDTKNVQRKLAQIGLLGLVPVIGNARKFVLGDVPNVPATVRLPGLVRPIYPRRGPYYAVLRDLMAHHGITDWKRVAVVGDIYELDLALPDALGCQVGLMANYFTPDYETAYVACHPRGRSLHSLDDALAFITRAP